MCDIKKINEDNNLELITGSLLEETRKAIDVKNTLSLPISQLSMLGVTLSSLLPYFRTVTHSIDFQVDDMYKIANKTLGDTLKIAKNGNFWGAMLTPTGKSKFAQLSEINSLLATTKTVGPIDPSLILVAMMTHSLEKDMNQIKQDQKKILSFLEVENESQIEADVETLMEIVKNYKYSWDNLMIVTNTHNVLMDIKNRSRKNILSFQKKINDEVLKKEFFASQGKINSRLADLVKKFKYYRLSLYIFSLSSLIEIMLAGNFKEDYILNIKNEIEKLSGEYRDYFFESSLYLEKISKTGIEKNLFKGIGIAGKSAGKVIGSLPLIKKGPVDEYLQNKGDAIYKSSQEIEKNLLRNFAELANPTTRILINKIENLNRIYNHTEKICFDKEKIYFL